jgi:hypothetical protein
MHLLHNVDDAPYVSNTLIPHYPGSIGMFPSIPAMVLRTLCIGPTRLSIAENFYVTCRA